MCFIRSYTKNIPTLEQSRKTTDQNENSKRRVNRGAASGGGGRRCGHRSTWTLPFLAGSHFTGCRVEKHTELPSVYVGMRVGGFLKLNALLCLNHCCSAPLIYLVPDLLTSLPSLGSGGKTSSSCSGSGPGSSSELWPKLWLWLQLKLLLVLVLWVFRSSPGPCFCSSLNFSSSSRFRPPSSEYIKFTTNFTLHSPHHQHVYIWVGMAMYSGWLKVSSKRTLSGKKYCCPKQPNNLHIPPKEYKGQKIPQCSILASWIGHWVG